MSKTTHSQREVVRVDDQPGATGAFFRERLAEGEVIAPHVKTFAKITVPAGTAMGYHQHVNDQEIYYILTGTGEYNDNGTILPLEAGDVFYCPAGDSHSISNTGEEDLTFIALITEL